MSTLTGAKVQPRKLYRGVFAARVIAVNPTIDEVRDLSEGQINLREETPARQSSTTSTGTAYTQERVRFLIKLPQDLNPVLDRDEYTFMDFFLRDLAINRGAGRWVGTSAGQLIYVADTADENEAIEKATSGELRSNHANAESGCIVEGAGELELWSFLEKSFNLDPYADGIQANYKELFFKDWENGDTDFDSLQQSIEEFKPSARVVLYVDQKGYQKVDTRSPLDTVFKMGDTKFATKLPKSIEKQQARGRKLISDVHDNVPLIAGQEVVNPAMLAADGGEDNSSIDSAADALG